MANKSLPLLSSKDVIAALKKLGFKHKFTSSKGNDHSYVRENEDGTKTTTIVPINEREIPKGTLKKILNLAEVTVSEFKKAAGIR